MCSDFKFIILGASLFISSAALAQTGEFVAAVPGADVHRGYALQDEWQQIRNATPSSASPRAVKKSKLEAAGSHDDSSGRPK
jgi:hypothetical protein